MQPLHTTLTRSLHLSALWSHAHPHFSHLTCSGEMTSVKDTPMPTALLGRGGRLASRSLKPPVFCSRRNFIKGVSHTSFTGFRHSRTIGRFNNRLWGKICIVGKSKPLLQIVQDFDLMRIDLIHLAMNKIMLNLSVNMDQHTLHTLPSSFMMKQCNEQLVIINVPRWRAYAFAKVEQFLHWHWLYIAEWACYWHIETKGHCSQRAWYVHRTPILKVGSTITNHEHKVGTMGMRHTPLHAW